MGQVRVRGLGKAYKRYAHKRGRFLEWLGARPQHELRWVLRDITFDVDAGEAVGIVGANGAGKSTLLKLIAGTTRATLGSVELLGSVSALLELGIGFHFEFTGRENVYMAGSIRGLRPAQIASHMAGIEEFAEIGDYFDQPLRTYSSGMQVRLAFSIATVTRPEVLIVDEALSVGDAYFAHKSFDRIRRFREQGTTLLFVSHNPGAVKTLCDRAVLIDEGQMIRDDTPDAVLDYYNAMIAVQKSDYDIRQTELETGHRSTRSGTQAVIVEDIQLLSGDQPIRALRVGDSATIRVMVRSRSEIPSLTAGILIRDRLGNDVFGTNTHHMRAQAPYLAPGAQAAVEFRFASLQLGTGTYSVTIALHTGDSHVASNYDWWDRALVFRIVADESVPTFIGVARMEVTANWTGGALPS